MKKSKNIPSVILLLKKMIKKKWLGKKVVIDNNFITIHHDVIRSG